MSYNFTTRKVWINIYIYIYIYIQNRLFKQMLLIIFSQTALTQQYSKVLTPPNWECTFTFPKCLQNVSVIWWFVLLTVSNWLETNFGWHKPCLSLYSRSYLIWPVIVLLIVFVDEAMSRNLIMLRSAYWIYIYIYRSIRSIIHYSCHHRCKNKGWNKVNYKSNDEIYIANASLNVQII